MEVADNQDVSASRHRRGVPPHHARSELEQERQQRRPRTARTRRCARHTGVGDQALGIPRYPAGSQETEAEAVAGCLGFPTVQLAGPAECGRASVYAPRAGGEVNEPEYCTRVPRVVRHDPSLFRHIARSRAPRAPRALGAAASPRKCPLGATKAEVRANDLSDDNAVTHSASPG